MVTEVSIVSYRLILRVCYCANKKTDEEFVHFMLNG